MDRTYRSEIFGHFIRRFEAGFRRIDDIEETQKVFDKFHGENDSRADAIVTLIVP